jgi:site-specific DNA recombinase
VDGQPHEPEATAIRTAIADVLEGKSIQQVTREWNAAGLTTTRAGATYHQHGEEYTVAGRWRPPRVRRVLVNPKYAGLKVHKGQVVDGVVGEWTPLIDVDTHQRLVSLLTDSERVATISWERRYPGAGIYRCGVCGGPMKSHQSGGGRQRRSYVCRNQGCVARNAQHLDDHVDNVILERLRKAKLVVGKKRGEGVAALQDQRAGWAEKLDNLSALMGDGTLDGPKTRQRAAHYKAEIAAIDRKLAVTLRVSPAGRLLASGGDLRAQWEKMDATKRSQVIDELVTVTVLPAKRGRGFDPNAVRIEWKEDV